MLSDSQLKLIAETLSNVGVAFFVSAVVPIFTEPKVEVGIFAAGTLLSVAIWLVSLSIIKKVNL